MSKTPLISIVMPLYNKADQVLTTIASVQAQSVCDWELIVVDDGSTDAGPAQVRALPDARIRVHSQLNAGVSAARNRGIGLANADLIAFLDADDLWQPDFLSAILALHADDSDARWYATGYEIRYPSGDRLTVRLRGLPPDFSRGRLADYFRVATISDPPVCSSAIAIRREALDSIGGFPVGIASGEDLLTWARLAVRYPLAYDVRPLAVFLVSGHDRPADPENRVGRELQALLREHPSVRGLRAYVGLWFRMQAVMAMRFDHLKLARARAWMAFWYGPLQWRNSYTLLLAWLPTVWRQRLDCTARRLLRSGRRA